MKISAILAASAISCTSAFAPSAGINNRASITAVSLGKEGNVEFGGNTWKPDSEKMGVSSVVPWNSCRASCSCILLSTWLAAAIFHPLNDVK